MPRAPGSRPSCSPRRAPSPGRSSRRPGCSARPSSRCAATSTRRSPPPRSSQRAGRTCWSTRSTRTGARGRRPPCSRSSRSSDGAPDAFVLPYGGGGNTSSYAQALRELGLETPIVSVEADTATRDARHGDPHRRPRARGGRRGLRGARGLRDGRRARRRLARARAEEGLFCEPSSAAGLAAVLRGDVEGERLVVTITGHGLKDPAIADRMAPPPVQVDPDPDAIAAAARR